MRADQGQSLPNQSCIIDAISPVPPGNRGRRVSRPMSAVCRASKMSVAKASKEIKFPGSKHESLNSSLRRSFPVFE